MAARQRLEMIGEGGVDRRAADRADDRHGLGGELLADRRRRNAPRFAKPAARRPAPTRPRRPAQQKARAFADRLGERGAHGEIAALERRLRPRSWAAEREHFDAGERGLGARRGPRPRARAISAIERNRIVVETGSSTGERGEAEGAADRAGRRRRRLVQPIGDALAGRLARGFASMRKRDAERRPSALSVPRRRRRARLRAGRGPSPRLRAPSSAAPGATRETRVSIRRRPPARGPRSPRPTDAPA